MSRPLSRRGFLTAAGASAAAAALPAVPGLPFLTGTALAQSQTTLADFADLRFGMFNHFNMGTFTDEEWATPNQNPARFAPSTVDCAQWAAAAAAAKMSYGVLTTKHHDGFCLWPTAYSSYNVMNSSYRQDIVRQYVDAFRARGLRVGLYFSIWDRTSGVQALGGHVDDPNATITTADINLVLNQLRELCSNYGRLDLIMTDGYAWQMGQHQVPYQKLRELVRSLQPTAVMIDLGGLSEPWLGDAIFFEEPLGIKAPAGNTYAATQGQTISNGWFWHPSTPGESLLSRDAIVSHLRDLEPKWTSFILNCPPSRQGRLDTNVVNRLTEVGAVWAPDTRRPTLPVQQARVEWPVTPVNAYATAARPGEGPLNAIDGRSDVNFEACWSTWGLNPALPHSITLDLGGVWSGISTLEYLPKQWHRTGTSDGDITGFTIHTSVDGIAWTQVASGAWPASRATKVAEWADREAGFVRLQANTALGGYANVSGLIVGGRSGKPVPVSRFPASGVTYRLVARHSGKVADVANCGTADGTDVRQWSWLGNGCQKWTFEPTGDGYFKIRNVHSRKLLEIRGLSRADGGHAGIWADADVPQQHWAITPVAQAYYMLVNRLSGRALDVAQAATGDGAGIDQWEYLGTPQQQWQIVVS